MNETDHKSLRAARRQRQLESRDRRLSSVGTAIRVPDKRKQTTRWNPRTSWTREDD